MLVCIYCVNVITQVVSRNPLRDDWLHIAFAFQWEQFSPVPSGAATTCTIEKVMDNSSIVLVLRVHVHSKWKRLTTTPQWMWHCCSVQKHGVDRLDLYVGITWTSHKLQYTLYVLMGLLPGKESHRWCTDTRMLFLIESWFRDGLCMFIFALRQDVGIYTVHDVGYGSLDPYTLFECFWHGRGCPYIIFTSFWK